MVTLIDVLLVCLDTDLLERLVPLMLPALSVLKLALLVPQLLTVPHATPQMLLNALPAIMELLELLQVLELLDITYRLMFAQHAQLDASIAQVQVAYNAIKDTIIIAVPAHKPPIRTVVSQLL